MKSLILIPSVFLLAACCTNPDVMTYQQVVSTPCCNQVRAASCCQQVRAAPTCCQRISYIYDEPVDVTTTVIDYY